MGGRKSVLGGLASLTALGLLCGTVAAQAPQPPQAAPQPAQAKPAAVVNGEAIEYAEIQAVLKQQPPTALPPTAAQKREQEQMAVNLLIEDLLMRQYLRKNAAPAPPADVQKEIDELVDALKKNNKMSLKDFLETTGQTEAQFRNDMAARVQWKNFILPRLPDNVVKAYYDANKLFFDKVFVHASHILIQVPATATAEQRQAAATKLAGIRAEILAGKLDFAKAAKDFSDCPTKHAGGDLGMIPFKFKVVEPFARAAFSLQVGQVSEIVTTEFGLHLIKVHERTKGEPSNFDAIKDQVREIYAQEVYQNIVLDMRKNSKIEVNLP
jgi:parvulin-like peptidyl-prolyl isomerase